jgi:hypothetical protein
MGRLHPQDRPIHRLRRTRTPTLTAQATDIISASPPLSDFRRSTGRTLNAQGPPCPNCYEWLRNLHRFTEFAPAWHWVHRIIERATRPAITTATAESRTGAG